MLDFDELWERAAALLPDEVEAAETARLLLSLLLLRRLDCLLSGSKDRVLAADRSMSGSLSSDRKAEMLCKITGEDFYNIYPQNMQTAAQSADTLLAYINGFAENVRFVLAGLGIYGLVVSEERYQPLRELAVYIAQLELVDAAAADLTAVWQKLAELAYGDRLLAKQQLYQLTADIFAAVCCGNPKYMAAEAVIYDPCMQNGRLLLLLRERLQSAFDKIEWQMAGQEADALDYSLLCAERLLTGDGTLNNFAAGSVLASDKVQLQADYIIADLPTAEDWSRFAEAVQQDYKSIGFRGRFSAGLPNYRDSQMLYMQQLVNCLLPMERGGGRAAFITDQHPLYDGGAGSGESEIRKWLFRLDIIEAVIALPEQTAGGRRYLWLCNNMKKASRRGVIQLIDADALWRESADEADALARLTALLLEPQEDSFSHIRGYEYFSYEEITLVRPWQRNYAVNQERLTKLLSLPRLTEYLDDCEQFELMQLLLRLGSKLCRSRDTFRRRLHELLQQFSRRLPLDLEELIIDALSEHDERAEVSLDKKGNAEIDPYWQDKEKIYLFNDVKAYFAAYVEPFAPQARIDQGKTKRGYELPFADFFPAAVKEASRHELAERLKRLERKLAAELGELT